MHESLMWSALNKQFQKIDIFARRITEKSVGGLPDLVAVDHKGSVAWIELKVAKVRPKAPPAIQVRPDQALWLADWARHWGRGGVLVRVLGLPVADQYWWFPAVPSIDWVRMWPNPTWEDLERYPPKEFSTLGDQYELKKEIFG